MTETPGPYEIITYENCTLIHSDDGVIAEFSCCDHEANAHRWLACVNSCKGLTTKQLEFAASKDDASRLFILCGQAHAASGTITARTRPLTK